MDRAVLAGWLLMLVSLAAILTVFWSLFLAPPPLQELALRVLVLSAYVVLLGLLAWVGYMVATMRPPESLERLEEELRRELEVMGVDIRSS